MERRVGNFFLGGGMRVEVGQTNLMRRLSHATSRDPESLPECFSGVAHLRPGSTSC